MANYIVLNEDQLLANLARKLPDVKFEVFLEVIQMCEVEQEPKTGQWIYKNYNWHCSECDETPKTLGYCGNADFMREHFKFCNHCGCRMYGEVEQ